MPSKTLPFGVGPAPRPLTRRAALSGLLGAAGWATVGCLSKHNEATPVASSAASALTPGGAQTSKMSNTGSENREIAILAGGCFWGMEEILRGIPGVLDTEVGYEGGTTPSPTYETVKTGSTGHAESVRIVFDPRKLSYADLLEHWFFRMHDPTTRNRQGNDVGSQYRSCIFFTSEAQKRTALEVKRRVEQAGRWGAPLVTEIVPAGPLTPAEDYHQAYLQKHPGGYTCHYLRDFPTP